VKFIQILFVSKANVNHLEYRAYLIHTISAGKIFENRFLSLSGLSVRLSLTRETTRLAIEVFSKFSIWVFF